jgi:hypothetical protein
MHKVFISYSNLDRPVAEAVCDALEASGVGCWIAPRDITPSKEWAEQIIDGISAARVMLLVFSSRSNGSPQVRREIERAIHKELSVIPLRIENVLPTKSLEYFLSAQHWFDAYDGPVEKHLPRLSGLVAELCNNDGASADGAPANHQSLMQPALKSNPYSPADDVLPARNIPGAKVQPDEVRATQAKASVAAPSNPFRESDLAIIEAQLARYIGPIARVLVRQTAQRSRDQQSLIEALTGELESPTERSAFGAACRKQLKT